MAIECQAYGQTAISSANYCLAQENNTGVVLNDPNNHEIFLKGANTVTYATFEPTVSTLQSTINNGTGNIVNGHASADLQGNSITCSGTNTFNATNGQVTSCSTTSYLAGNSVSCSGANTINATNGQITGCSTTSYVPTTSVHVSYQQNVMLAADVSTTGGTWVALLNVNLAGYASTGDTINCWASTSGGGSTGIPRIRIRQVNNNVDGVTKAFHQTSGGGPSNLSGVYASKLYNTPVQLVMYLDYSAGDTGTFSISGASDADNSAALLCQVMANVP